LNSNHWPLQGSAKTLQWFCIQSQWIKRRQAGWRQTERLLTFVLTHNCARQGLTFAKRRALLSRASIGFKGWR